MTDESAISELRERIGQMGKDKVKVARRMATTFGVLAILGLTAGVYGYVQQRSAESWRDEAIQMERTALNAEEKALQLRDRSKLNRKIAEQSTNELQDCRMVRK